MPLYLNPIWICHRMQDTLEGVMTLGVIIFFSRELTADGYLLEVL